MFPYRIRRILIIVREYFSVVFPVMAAIVVLFLLIFSIRNYQVLKDEITSVSSETNKLKSRVDILKKGKTLAENEIDEINQLFSILIPDTEDFFSIIYALEKISQESGFNIDEYNINFGSTAERTLISISGTGNINSFMNFLKSYQFAGGRFATSESIDFSNSKFSSANVNLFFYSKKVTIDTELKSEMTDSDIEFIRKIKGKIKIQFKENSNEASSLEDYKIKADPFTNQILEPTKPTSSPSSSLETTP